MLALALEQQLQVPQEWSATNAFHRLCSCLVFKVPEGHPSVRLSEEICISEGSQGPLRKSLRAFCSARLWGGSAGVRGIFRGQWPYSQPCDHGELWSLVIFRDVSVTLSPLRRKASFV